MDNNKKKALLKSVAAFTFAMSMFAAQSPTASAMGEDAVELNNMTSIEEKEEEEEIVPEVNNTLKNSNGKEVGVTYKDSDFYDENAELGIANDFHIFTNGTVENNAHVNGNIAANKLGSDKNFGTNDLYEADIVYIENVDTKINRTNTEMTIVLGSDVTIEEYNHENGYMVVDSEGNEIYSENYKDNVFVEQEDTKYIDLDTEMKQYEMFSDVLANKYNAEYDGADVKKDFSDINNSYIVINEDGLSVVNMKASDFANIALFNIRNLVGCDDDSDQTLLINVDGEGTDVVINSQVKVYYEDGTERKNDEVTNFTDSRILWNFINTNNITIKNIFSGCVLAPNADITFAGSNFDGNVIAQNVAIDGGESHRWDFHGDLQLELEDFEDYDSPTSSSPDEEKPAGGSTGGTTEGGSTGGTTEGGST
ncbi:MAG: choice-of-anchor A family protein, partial [Oscillospiraceae bacterium]|nr:choice-of-anchor A family protein [Oscillospiraceae bacterium]